MELLEEIEAEVLQSDFEKLFEKHLLDPNEEIDPPLSVLEYSDGKQQSVFCTLGNFSLIIGKAKVKKTFLVAFFVAFLLNPSISHSFESHNQVSHIAVFDTEQSRDHAQEVQRRILLAAGIRIEPSRFRYFTLRSMSTAERLDFIEKVLYRNSEIRFAIIDGIRDLVADINSPEEATLISSKLLKWTEELGIHIICVLHQNKGDGNARGHLGTELTNKAESVLSVTKDPKNPAISFVAGEYMRDREFNAFAFGVNDSELPYIIEDYSESSSPSKTALLPKDIPDAEHQAILTTVLSNGAHKRYEFLCKEISAEFKKRGRNIGQNKAKDFKILYEEKGWIKSIKREGERYTTYFLVERQPV